MDRQLNKLELELDSPIPYAWAAVIAYAMVVLVFVADWFTPESVVVDLAYQAPVVFAALKGSRRLAVLTVILGFVGIVLGWFTDLANASFVFSDVRIENRLLSAVSLFIVGALAIVIQKNAQRTIDLDNAQARRRASTVASAFGRVVSALSPGTVVQAIAGEAPEILEAAAVVWFPARIDGPLWLSMRDAAVKPLERPSSTDFQAVAQLLGARGCVEVVSTADTIDVLIGKAIGFKNALAIPVGEDTRNAGILFASFDRAIDVAMTTAAADFARFASLALQQSEYVSRSDVRGAA